MKRPSASTQHKILSMAVIFLLGFTFSNILNSPLVSQAAQKYNIADSYFQLPAASAQPEPQNFLSFQGKLTTAAGAAVTTATTFQFSIYDQPTAGNLIYNETQTITPDSNGLFYAEIGSAASATGVGNGSPAGSQLWPPSFSIAYWLAVRIGSSGAYLSPLISITNAPYQFNRAASPLVSFVSSTNTCSISSASASAGLTTALTYTTSATTSGQLHIGMDFNVASPATLAVTSTWQVIYGTGSAPACDATTGLGTTVGNPYTIETQVGAVGSWGQSITFGLDDLIPSTTYWFSVQVTDSSAGTWVYKNQALSIKDVLGSTTNFPLLSFATNTNTCTHTGSATDLMAGLDITYTTLPAVSGSGNLKVGLTFQLQSPAVSADTNKWILAYGTGADACNQAASGTTVGKQYTFESDAAAVTKNSQSISVVIQGLLPATTYWFDVQSTDLSSSQWITSNPSLDVTEEPNINGVTSPSNIEYPLSAQTAGCATTAASTTMAGLKEIYTLTSNSMGNIHGTLTFNVLASGTIAAGSTTAYTVAYSDITTNTLPACAAASVGTSVGQPYTVETVNAVAFSLAQKVEFTITGLTPGHTYWIDLKVTNTGTSFTATYSVPTLTIVDPQQSSPPADNQIFLTGNAPSCTPGSSPAMAGMAVIPTTANPPMEYQTMSYGSGQVQVTMSMQIVTAAAKVLITTQLSYGAVTDGTLNPACAAGATGTTVGNAYSFEVDEAVITDGQAQVTVVIPNLAHGTMYWFDFKATIGTVSDGTYTVPQLAISETT